MLILKIYNYRLISKKIRFAFEAVHTAFKIKLNIKLHKCLYVTCRSHIIIINLKNVKCLAKKLLHFKPKKIIYIKQLSTNFCV